VNYTHYDYLDLAPGASTARIEAAYAQVLQRFQFGHTDAGQDLSGLVRMIHSAYRVLSDPDARRAYDEQLAHEAALATRSSRRCSTRRRTGSRATRRTCPPRFGSSRTSSRPDNFSPVAAFGFSTANTAMRSATVFSSLRARWHADAGRQNAFMTRRIRSRTAFARRHGHACARGSAASSRSNVRAVTRGKRPARMLPPNFVPLVRH
jgi:DnaJ-class molecular chaperone